MRAAQRPPSPGETLGVPFIPPPPATSAANRLRGLLGSLGRAMAPPPVRILESALGLLDHRALVALCDAGVPEALQARMTVPELARRTGGDPESLERLARYAAGRGWLGMDRRGRVRPNRVTRFLRSDHPGGWRSWVDFVGGDEITGAVGLLSAADPPGGAFAEANGAPFFEWMAAHPGRWETFDAAMGAGARMHALVLWSALDWTATRSFCDVGGGTAELATALLEMDPGLRAGLLELPEVIERARSHERLRHVPGDAFESVPEGFDTYLLVNVLHDWNDADAVRILESVAGALPAEGRVVVVESEPATPPADDLSIRADLLMHALTPGGRERDRHEIGALARRAGLVRRESIGLASGDVAHILGGVPD